MVPNSVYFTEKVINYSRRKAIPYLSLHILMDQETNTKSARDLLKDLVDCPLLGPKPWYNKPYINFDNTGMKIVWDLMPRGQLENYGPYRDKQTELSLYAKDMCEKNNIKVL